MKSRREGCIALIVVLSLGLNGCGGGGASAPQLTVQPAASTVTVAQDGAPAAVALTVTGASTSPTVELSGLPSGINWLFTVGSSGGTLSLTGSSNAAPGSYMATITATSGKQSGSATLTVISAPVAVVGNSVDTALGVNGRLEQFMSTSFQVGGWTPDYFGTGATRTAREAKLNALAPQHIRVQVVSGGIPMVGNTGTASDWDFSTLDMLLQPVLESADHSPELQVGTAPAWMCKSNGYLDVTHHLNDFAAFMANMVRYYNKGGFDAGGKHFQSPSPTPVILWGIFNEFNINGLTAQDYVSLYNTVVPAMLAVDPTIRLSAFEFSDWGLGTGDGGDPQVYFPPFVAPIPSGGMNTQMNVVSTHFYSSCNQTDTDAQLFSTVPQFVANVNYLYQALQTRPDLAGTPVWVTENNVNADWSNNGMSECNPGKAFVDDHRGTSAFFAAWRPYVFSQLGKAGNQALYHWAYSADQQYGEVDGNGNTFLSYWVDQTLTNEFPSTPTSPGPEILTLNATDASTVETLATRNADGSVVVMVVDRAVASASDNNGAGLPRTVVVDISSLGTFTSADEITLDAASSVSSALTPVTVIPAARIAITLPGYGVSFLNLKP